MFGPINGGGGGGGSAGASNLGVVGARFFFISSGNVSSGNQLLLGGRTYEFRAAAESLSDDLYVAVLIGATPEDSMTNLLAAINATAVTPHPSIFKTNGVTHAVSRNTVELVLASSIGYPDFNGMDPTNVWAMVQNSSSIGGAAVAGLEHSYAINQSGSLGWWPSTTTDLTLVEPVQAAGAFKYAAGRFHVNADQAAESNTLTVNVPFTTILGIDVERRASNGVVSAGLDVRDYGNGVIVIVGVAENDRVQVSVWGQ